MLYWDMDACNSNGATAVFTGCLDRPLERGSAPSSAAGDRRCILIDLGVRVILIYVDVVCFTVCKCMHNPNEVCIVLSECQQRMLGGNADHRTSDQGVKKQPRDRFARDLGESWSRSDNIPSYQVQLHRMQ